MARILSYATAPDETERVGAIAAMLADTLCLDVEHRQLPTEADVASSTVLEDVAAADVAVAALPFTAGHRARTDLDVLRKSPKPILVVPVRRGARTSSAIERVLVPLDGTPESARAVRDVVRMFAKTGTEVVVLHVFAEKTVPRFWDQAAHAGRAWGNEFLARFCDEPGARIELRSGVPGERVVDVATSESVDLIALGWSRNLAAGHARTVRAILAEARIPLLLVPVTDGGALGDDARSAAPERATR